MIFKIMKKLKNKIKQYHLYKNNNSFILKLNSNNLKKKM